MSDTPRMERASNESLVAVYEQGCQLERELAEVTKQRDELADALNQLMDVVATTDAAYDDRWATEIEINDAWHAGNKALKTLKGGQP